MEVHRQNGTLTVKEVRELNAANARSFRDDICAALSPGLEQIDIDLSLTSQVDSCGLGALASVFKAASEHGGQKAIALRLHNLQPPVQQIFELTRMHHLFEIVPHSSAMAKGHSKVKGAGNQVSM